MAFDFKKAPMSVICYIPTLEGQADVVQQWLCGVRERLGVIPVMLPTVDWNNDLTPWPEGPIFRKGKPFGGKADEYLSRLEREIIPDIEAEMGIVPDERWIVGVSLAGLFAVWAAARTNLFHRIGSVSGSFWYPGFVEWFSGQTVSAKSAYISLGNKEADGKNKHLQSIADDTASVVRTLEQNGIRTTFEWTEGTHFGPVVPRLEKAVEGLIKHL